MVTWQKYFLQFKKPAGTSRGILRYKETYILKWKHRDDAAVAWGECNVFRGLSSDDRPNYEEKLTEVCQTISQNPTPGYDTSTLRDWPSIQMGVEMLLRDQLNGCRRIVFDNEFTAGRRSIPINGLIWMAPKEEMLAQVKARLQEGFRCIKIKIGAIDFESELDVLRYIRRQFGRQEVEIRVDANGAFSPEEAMEKLKRLSDFGLHSIEQPIRAKQWDHMASLAADSPVPVALDEELIGIYSPEKKRQLLEWIRPPFIILKPALAGGFAGCDEWIDRLTRQGGQWWVTSALESNLGLNAIAQYAATKHNKLPQGLGTGSLYTNNFDSPLCIENGHLKMNHDKSWDLNRLG